MQQLIFEVGLCALHVAMHQLFYISDLGRLKSERRSVQQQEMVLSTWSYFESGLGLSCSHPRIDQVPETCVILQ